MRVNQTAIYKVRAAFGMGFVALGAFALWRVAVTPVSQTSKLTGAALGLAMIGLGIVRVVQYARLRRTTPSG